MQLELSYVSQDKSKVSHETQDSKPKLQRCPHIRSFPGLDACYCADCGRSIHQGTVEYNELMRNTP